LNSFVGDSVPEPAKPEGQDNFSQVSHSAPPREEQLLSLFENRRDRPHRFPSYSLRLDHSYDSKGWVLFNRDSGFDMTYGTWILSSDMEIVGGPLPAVTSVNGEDNPKNSTGDVLEPLANVEVSYIIFV